MAAMLPAGSIFCKKNVPELVRRMWYHTLEIS